MYEFTTDVADCLDDPHIRGQCADGFCYLGVVRPRLVQDPKKNWNTEGQNEGDQTTESIDQIQPRIELADLPTLEGLGLSHGADLVNETGIQLSVIVTLLVHEGLQQENAFFIRKGECSVSLWIRIPNIPGFRTMDTWRYE